jgi:predicted AAA+ superfamily ATPase
VDFVLERGRELWAIEVKAGREVGTRQTASIQRMAETERMVKRKILVYQGTHRRKSNDIEIVPVLDFLSELASI